MAIDNLLECRLDGKQCFKGDLLDVQQDTVLLPNGKTAVREYIKHVGAVAVIALLGDVTSGYEIVLERQFRYPMSRVMIEVPAGKVDATDMDTWATAKRELQEETGYVGQQWAKLGVIHPCIAYSDEYIEIWLTNQLKFQPRSLDEGEFIEVFALPVDEMLAWCRSGQITDAKTLSAAFFLQHFLDGKLAINWLAS